MAFSKESVPLCDWLGAGINMARRLASAEKWVLLECSWVPLTSCVAIFEITAGKISGAFVIKGCNVVLWAPGVADVYISITCEFVCLIQILLDTCSPGWQPLLAVNYFFWSRVGMGIG